MFERITKFLFTKKEKPGVVQSLPPAEMTQEASIEPLFEPQVIAIPEPDVDSRTADDFFDPPEPRQVFKDDPPRNPSPPVPSSIKDGVIATIRASFVGRWFMEKKHVSETGMTTRQRIKRYNAMHDGELNTDTTTVTGKVSTGVPGKVSPANDNKTNS